MSASMDTTANNQILILGGGFTGLFAALHLSSLDCPLPITLIDRETRFVFKPLLYELLSNETQVDVTWPRYEELLTRRGVAYVLGSIQAIDLHNRQVQLDSGLSYGYRYLVVALGDTAGYFNVSGADEHTFTFRTAQDALELGKHLRQNLQKALQAEDSTEKDELLTTAIVGAGPSGVELSGTLADLLPHWYEKLGGDPEDIRVVLIQRGEEILGKGVSDRIRETAEKALGNRRARIDILTQSSVKEVKPGSLVYLNDEQEHYLDAETIVWTAGSSTHPLVQSLPIADEHSDRRQRPHTTSTLQLIDFPNVFAGGDCAVNIEDPQPATAQVAYQQGKTIAYNIKALIDEEELEPASVNLRGYLMKLGVEESVAEILGKVRISGHAGHLIRHATYLSLMPTPARNMKLGAEWLADEVLDQVLNV